MTFDQLRLADYQFPTVALFYANACKPCELLKPRLREACKALGARLEEFNTAGELAAARALGLRSAPTVVVVHKGQATIVFSGLINDYRQIMDKLLSAGVRDNP
jgi:thioredoxin-like negative regulator of GroEL